MRAAAPLRLIFADDDDASRALVRVLVGLVDGVEIVGEAVNGLEAVTLADANEVDLVLLDVNMPAMDGITAAEAILAGQPDAEVILHTSEPHLGRVRRAAGLGITINDKAKPDQLIARLEQLVSGTGLEGERTTFRMEASNA